jgi:hypothetical protein
MTESSMSTAELARRLEAHPDLRSQIESLVLAVEDETGELKTADDIEMRIIEIMRRTGHDAIQSWAQNKVEKTSQELKQTAGVWSDGKKKLCWHTTFGDISIDEPQYRDGTKRVRPFAQSAQVSNRSCSSSLQRVVTDFGADQPFAKARDKVIEHYGVALGESTIARITEGHAKNIFETAAPPQDWPTQAGSSTTIIVEMDGGMVPIVDIDETQTDKRKGKTLRWAEAKMCLAHPQGSKTLAYGGTFLGGVDIAGQCLFDCAVQAGFGIGTPVHGVGDGAPWIADQMEEKFGAQGSYLIDFYHICDYLSAAGKVIVSSEQEQKKWMDEQKDRLKTNKTNEVLQELQTHLELPTVQDSDAPVRQCHRYLDNRRDQLNYKDAIKRGLPIGSGEIESSHRYVVQDRMKRPGAWWRPHNAAHMLALRLNRANCQWNSYWKKISSGKQEKVSTSL